jgi:hypothetical protein
LCHLGSGHLTVQSGFTKRLEALAPVSTVLGCCHFEIPRAGVKAM